LYHVNRGAATCLQAAMEHRSAMLTAMILHHTIQIDNIGYEHQDQLMKALGIRVIEYYAMMSSFLTLWKYYMRIDSELGDIPIAEEVQQPYHHERHFERINSFLNNDEAKTHTNFTRDELQRIIDIFELPVKCHCPRADGQYSTFHHEELLIFTLIKLKRGATTAELVDDVVGGRSEDRWGYGYKWMITHLDKQYQDILGCNGLERWVPQFATFAEHIHQNIGKPRYHVDEFGMANVEAGIYFPPGEFGICGFIDCSDHKICRPHSGPAGDYLGVMRCPNWYIVQRAFYQRHIRTHGIHVLTFCLPNGLTGGLYGPVSSRRHDTTVVEMSDIGPFLNQIQQNQPLVYSFYGDSAFRTPYACIKIQHEAAVNAPLTA
jgi:hypothetical protein